MPGIFWDNCKFKRREQSCQLWDLLVYFCVMFNLEDIERWEKRRSSQEPDPWRVNEEESALFAWHVGRAEIILLHLDSYLRFDIRGSDAYQKYLRELGNLPGDLIGTPQSVIETGRPYIYFNPQKPFSFEPQHLYLGHTLENIELQSNEQIYLWPYFFIDEGGELIRTNLRSHLNAPLIQSGTNFGNPGPVTYEILNYDPKSLIVPVSKLVCPAGFIRTEEPIRDLGDRSSKNFAFQRRGIISLGNFSINPEARIIQEAKVKKLALEF